MEKSSTNCCCCCHHHRDHHHPSLHSPIFSSCTVFLDEFDTAAVAGKTRRTEKSALATERKDANCGRPSSSSSSTRSLTRYQSMDRLLHPSARSQHPRRENKQTLSSTISHPLSLIAPSSSSSSRSPFFYIYYYYED